MNKEEYREARKYYSRREIAYYWTKWKLKQLKIFLCHLWFKISKYEHEHFYYPVFTCLICRKSKIDIDREMYKNHL